MDIGRQRIESLRASWLSWFQAWASSGSRAFSTRPGSRQATGTGREPPTHQLSPATVPTARAVLVPHEPLLFTLASKRPVRPGPSRLWLWLWRTPTRQGNRSSSRPGCVRLSHTTPPRSSRQGRVSTGSALVFFLGHGHLFHLFHRGQPFCSWRLHGSSSCWCCHCCCFSCWCCSCWWCSCWWCCSWWCFWCCWWCCWCCRLDVALEPFHSQGQVSGPFLQRLWQRVVVREQVPHPIPVQSTEAHPAQAILPPEPLQVRPRGARFLHPFSVLFHLETCSRSSP